MVLFIMLHKLVLTFKSPNETLVCDHKSGNPELLLFQVKFLTNKLGAAMVQMSDKVASEMIIRNLSGATLFDSKINIM